LAGTSVGFLPRRPDPPPFSTPASPVDSFGNPATFTAAAKTQGSDYDKIMAEYDQLIKQSTLNPLRANPTNAIQVQAPGAVSYNQVTPQLSPYSQSEDVTGSLANLSDLATTGGYSEGDINNIRERAVSPIRSIYANARENAERNKALGGGYSPNLNAANVKMARDEANQIGDITTNANAAIAQNVAANKLSAAPAYASASERANESEMNANARNADIINQINQANTTGMNDTSRFNASLQEAIAQANANRATGTQQFNSQMALDAAKTNRGNIQGALAGKTSLYGTTPALVNTFGNQVVQAKQLGQNQQQLGTQRMGTIMGAASRFGQS